MLFVITVINTSTNQALIPYSISPHHVYFAPKQRHPRNNDVPLSGVLASSDVATVCEVKGNKQE